MADVRSGKLVFGVAFVVMGYALLVIALAEQAQRSAASSTARAPAVESSTAPPPSSPRASPDEAVAPPAPVVTAPAVTLPAASAAPAASIVPPGGESSEADARLFKFSAGGAVMSRDEVQRLLALGKVLAHRPLAKVSIEGFGDLPGSEPLMIGIAKHRAKVAQTLLAKAGVTEDRVSTAFTDMGSDARLARSIRVTTTPPLSEIEKP